MLKFNPGLALIGLRTTAPERQYAMAYRKFCKNILLGQLYITQRISRTINIQLWRT